MLKYKPIKSIGAASEAVQEFTNLEEMMSYVYDYYNVIQGSYNLFSREDFIIHGYKGDDSSTGWKNTFGVCIRRCGDELYDEPQCIGICSFNPGEMSLIDMDTIINSMSN